MDQLKHVSAVIFLKYNHSLSNICNVTYMSHWAFMINFMLHKSHLAFISHLENKCKKKICLFSFPRHFQN